MGIVKYFGIRFTEGIGMSNRSDLGTGATLITFGAAYSAMTLRNLPLGDISEIGPGFFPFLLSSLLTFLGVVVLVRGGGRKPEAKHPIPWRALVVITMSVLAFALLLPVVGLGPAVFVSTFIAIFAQSGMSLPAAFATSLAITTFCIAVFSYGVGLPVPVYPDWI